MKTLEGKSRLPIFTTGDLGGLAYSLTNNIVNFIIVIATLSGLGWSQELIYGRVIPGMSVGLMTSGLYYAYMAHKLSKKEGRSDVTAMPSGVSTPAMFVFLYGVITPLSFAIEDPEIVWSAAIAACFIGGAVECLGGIIGPWLKKSLPRAALLGTVAGIGFIWMATQGLFDIYGDPVLGLPIALLAVIGLFGGYLFPKKIPPFSIAIIGGIVYAFCLGRIQPDFSGIGFFFPNPANTIQALLSGFTVVAPYLAVIIPIEIYNFIETMDNVESANAAGDNYSVREAQFADGTCTMLSAICGGCIPNTVWLGHAGLKKAGAGAGFSWVSGLLLGGAGIFGFFSFINSVVPPAICAITFLWCAVVMVCQSFKEVPAKHYAAVAIAMIPSVADYMFSQIGSALGAVDVWTEPIANGLTGYSAELTQALIANGLMWNGVPGIKAGAIIVGLMWGGAVAYIIDKKLDRAGFIFLAGGVLSFFGFIHRANLCLAWDSPFMIGYFVMAVLCFILHTGRKTWFKGPDHFDYV